MIAIPIAALVLSALFAGAALYITLVEQPARLCLDDASQLAQWQPSYRKALPLQAGLALAGGMAGLAACGISGDWKWLPGSLVLLANWPVTFLFIMPVNKRLQAMRPDEAGAESRQLLVRWGGLHNVRSMLGMTALLLFAWTLIATH